MPAGTSLPALLATAALAAAAANVVNNLPAVLMLLPLAAPSGPGAAARRLGRPCAQMERHGRAEREVVAAAEGADLLILARDGDRVRLGPKSLGPASRFVVDHAPCPVLLVWPGDAPSTRTIPPAPARDHPPPRDHPPRPR